MKRNRNGHSRTVYAILALWLCITLVPFSSFAGSVPENGVENGDNTELILGQDEDGAEALQAEEQYPDEAADELSAEPEDTAEPEEQAGEEYQDEIEVQRPAEADAAIERQDAGSRCAPGTHVLQRVEAVPATCMKQGIKGHSVCTVCGALFDYNMQNEVTEQSLIIPVTAHTWSKYTDIVKPTIDKNGIRRHYCAVCGTYYDEDIVYGVVPATGKSFKLDGNKLQFKSAVAKSVPSFMKEARIRDIWIKAAKKKITVYWTPAKRMERVDGVIILRKTGKSKVYKEIKRISFKNNSSGTARWSPKSSYTDKKAKKKNKAYSYVLVSYFTSSNGYVYISHCSEWAAGQTTASKLKNAYKAKINKKTADMQYNDKITLKISHNKPGKTFMKSSFRWYSDNTAIAKVNKKGVVTAMAPGTTTIRGRLPSGKDVKCTVDIVGAFTPSTPSLSVDVASNSSITLVWRKCSYATSYDLYQSSNGVNWSSPMRVTGTSKKVTGLKKGHKYSFYLVARNDNGKYTALSNKSNVVAQKAVIKRRPTTVTGWPSNRSPYSGTTFSVSLNIGSPDRRRAQLQMYQNRSWVTKKTVYLPDGAGTYRVNISFPNDWWGGTTTWRLVIPRSATSEDYTTRTLVIKSSRRYQNPSGYVQISDSISKHGYNYYTSPVLVNSNSTRSDHVEALIRTANKYKGDSYVNGRSGAPGNGIDASGLVIQACYGAGVDLWPISPATRPSNCAPSLMNLRLASRKYTSDHRNINRGDLIFFYTGGNTVGHVAIYLGYDKIIHASLVTGRVETSTITALTKKFADGGKYGYTVAGCRRIFVN